MKRRINAHFMAIAAIAIIFTLIFSSIIFYRIFEQNIMDDLKSYAEIVKNTNICNQQELEVDIFSKVKNLRITLVDESGNVIYDSENDVSKLENHSDRPEIEEAMKKGQGQSVRKSETMNKSNYYYAVLLENGMVFRVAKETSSIWNIYFNAVPVILVVAVFLLAFCIMCGHVLTQSLVEPIENMAANLDHLERVETYKELLPFIQIIRTQHEDILKNSRLRQEFTANVTHELKTPLTAISGYSELIENGMATEEDVKRFAKEIHRNAKRLLTLINDILKLSQMDAASKKQIVLEEVDLYDIAKNCKEMLEVSAKQNKVELHLNGEHTIIMANKNMMEEVVYNLCDNAIRYNHEGGNVYLDVSHDLVVRDDGIGIPKEHQERIFERFFRVDKSRSKKTGGTGLGLAIVKHIVELHDAKLELESEVDKGTKITVHFTK